MGRVEREPGRRGAVMWWTARRKRKRGLNGGEQCRGGDGRGRGALTGRIVSAARPAASPVGQAAASDGVASAAQDRVVDESPVLAGETQQRLPSQDALVGSATGRVVVGAAARDGCAAEADEVGQAADMIAARSASDAGMA
eukprot:jgi/Ulvmu1/1080/UM105_0039.1